MNQFDGPLQIQYDTQASNILQGDYWRVMKSFRFYLPSSDIANEWTCYDTNRWVFVPAGMLTDLGSIPPIYRGIFDRGGRSAQAYVLHDQLCEYLSVTKGGNPERITRQECDLILRSAMLSLGINKATTQSVYNAVATYAALKGIRSPSTTIKKRSLEAAFNFEGL